jgi:hypothetical protein
LARGSGVGAAGVDEANMPADIVTKMSRNAAKSKCGFMALMPLDMRTGLLRGPSSKHSLRGWWLI